MESISSSDAKLFNSSASGDKEGVITALAQGGRVTVRSPQGGTPLLVAAQNGHTDICGLLLAHGNNVNDVDPLCKNTALQIFLALQKQAAIFEGHPVHPSLMSHLIAISSLVGMCWRW